MPTSCMHVNMHMRAYNGIHRFGLVSEMPIAQLVFARNKACAHEI
jgi:hypothetical protein